MRATAVLVATAAFFQALERCHQDLLADEIRALSNESVSAAAGKPS